MSAARRCGCRAKAGAVRLERGSVGVVAGSSSSALAARLELAAAAAMPGERLGYAVVNTGELPIMLGEAYELERVSDDGWERFPVPYMFRMWGRRLEPGGRSELTARVPELAESGRYRLHPGYEWVAGQEIEPIEVVADFEVMRD